MIRSQKRIRLCTVLLVLNLAVIWGNSLLPGTTSGQVSGSVLEPIVELLHLPEETVGVLHTVIRKLAHFTEFACLGVLLTWYRGMCDGKCSSFLPVLLGMAAATVDESIQLFIPGRGPSLVDVWLDTFGAATGMMLLRWAHHKKEHKQS